MFLQSPSFAPETRALDRRRWPVAPNSHPVTRRPFVGRNSASASRSPPRRSASSMSRFWSSPVSSRGCPGTALCALLAADRFHGSNLCLARNGRPSRAAVPVAGAKADAGWNGFLGPLGRARRLRVADALHAAVLAASFHTCRGAHAAVPPGIARFSRSSGAFAGTPESAASLAQECLQCSLLSLSGYTTTTVI